jgi:hypothetical protein
MLGLDKGLRLLKRLSDIIFNPLPFSGFDAQEELGTMFLVITRVLFIAASSSARRLATSWRSPREGL